MDRDKIFREELAVASKCYKDLVELCSMNWLKSQIGIKDNRTLKQRHDNGSWTLKEYLILKALYQKHF